MPNRGKILLGILVFSSLVTFPFLYARGRVAPAPEPDLNTPVIQMLADKTCVEDLEYMRSNHMKLLNDWRTQAVRNGTAIYTGKDGRQYPMSLEKSCLSCHSNPAQFCDRCHSYAQVQPNCWECHVRGN